MKLHFLKCSQNTLVELNVSEFFLTHSFITIPSCQVPDSDAVDVPPPVGERLIRPLSVQVPGVVANEKAIDLTVQDRTYKQ
jgi:hypothetical protein